MTKAPTPYASFFPRDNLTAQERRADVTALRKVADNAAFYMLCRQGRGVCTRAQKCRGNPHECVGRFANLMPEEAYDWIEATLRGYREGLTFDQLAEEYPDELVAIAEWRRSLKTAFSPFQPARRNNPARPNGAGE